MEVKQKHDLRIAADFFFQFARFEYAMKAVGYRNSENGEAKPDWHKLSEDMEETFKHPPSNSFTEALDYYWQHPPMKQIVKNGNLKWAVVPPTASSQADRVLQYVRRVRNNLFHGGKFEGGYLEDPERSETLMKYGLIILDECLNALPKLRQAYEG